MLMTIKSFKLNGVKNYIGKIGLSDGLWELVNIKNNVASKTGSQYLVLNNMVQVYDYETKKIVWVDLVEEGPAELEKDIYTMP